MTADAQAPVPVTRHRWPAIGAVMALLSPSFAGRMDQLPIKGSSRLPILALAFGLLVTAAVAVRMGAEIGKLYVPFGGLTIVFLAVLSVSWSYAPGITESRIRSFGIVSAAAMFLGACLSLDDVRRAIALTARIAVGVSLLTVVFLPSFGLGTSSRFPDTAGWVGLASGKNQLGFVACLGIACELGRRTKHANVWPFLHLVAVLGSRSSTALASTLLVIAFHTTHQGLRRVRDRGTRTVLAASLVAAGFATVAISFVKPGFVTGLFGKDATLTGRGDIWSTVLGYVNRRPFFGYGWNSVWPTTPGGPYPSQLSRDAVRISGFDVINAHSGYLDLMLSVGLVGLAVVLGVVGCVAIRSLRFRSDGYWVLAVLLGFLVDSLSESNFNLGFVGVIFLVSAATLQPRHGPVESTTTPLQTPFALSGLRSTTVSA